MRVSTFLKPLSFIPALLLMYMIYSFSAQEGDTSSNLSYKVSYKIVQSADKLFDVGLEEYQVENWAYRINHVTRKLAHMTEYFLLAIAVAFPLYVYGVRGLLLLLVAGFICVAYAAGDEYHQTFVSDRSGCLRDVGIDSIGIFIGILVTRAIGWTGRKTIFRSADQAAKTRKERKRLARERRKLKKEQQRYYETERSYYPEDRDRKTSCEPESCRHDRAEHILYRPEENYGNRKTPERYERESSRKEQNSFRDRPDRYEQDPYRYRYEQDANRGRQDRFEYEQDPYRDRPDRYRHEQDANRDRQDWFGYEQDPYRDMPNRYGYEQDPARYEQDPYQESYTDQVSEESSDELSEDMPLAGLFHKKNQHRTR